MGERIYEQDTLCLAAVETTYGVDAAPTSVANAMRVKAELNLLDGDQEVMEYDAGRGGSKGTVQRNKRITGTLTGYLAGVGTPGDLPAISPLLRCAGLVPAVVENEKVTFSPVSTSHESCTLHVFRGKLKHTALGARCSLEMNLGTSALPKFTFNNLISLFADPTQVSDFQSADFTAYEKPMVTDPLSITKMKLFGQDVNMSEMVFRLGNNVVYRAVTNDESAQIVSRAPQVEITFEEPLIEEFDWWKKLSAFGSLQYQIGNDVSDEGHIFELDIPNLQLSSIAPTVVDGISHLQMTLDVVPTARDNDFTMIFR